MKKFAMIGAAGFVAPRHMAAIKETGNTLVAAIDKSDSIGVMDSYFPKSEFFTEFERFDRHVDKLRRLGSSSKINYTSICSPNYLHDSHIRFALRSGTDAICEKPLVLNPWNIDGLIAMENDTGRKVNTILQLRLHPTIIKLKEMIKNSASDTKFDVNLTYIASRGRWYLRSWKGDEKRAGGIATNIGVHFYDMLHFVFGELQENKVHLSSASKASGYLEYEKARVCWFLSVDAEDIPNDARSAGRTTFRAITVNDKLIEFSDGFADLHTLSYNKILEGHGFGLEENRVAIETVAQIRNSKLSPLTGDYHSYLKKI